MALKRKRSDESDSPLSTTTDSSRDHSTSPTPIFPRQDDNTQWSNLGPWSRPSSSQLGSRTRKRQRDNRPDEDTVHATTYLKLFNAVRSPFMAPESSSRDSPTPPPRTRPPPPQRQPSLHNFWSICTPARPAMDEMIEEATPIAQCEDCERPLPRDEDVSMHGMDDDIAIGDYFSCRYCHRRVCDMCAVIETGLGRDCLQCRTSRRQWVGGLGWVP